MSRDQFIKMRGAWDTRHWIKVPGLSHAADALQLEQCLTELDGVQRVQIVPDRRRIRVTYDQTQTDYQTILERLAAIGFPASESWWSARKATWFQYLDRNARDNAQAPEPPCCSNPKGISAGKVRKK
ncbi:heavy-metal-associated domain-containing protein [Sedimenticola sp.]|uniref:heavy-metal-associated domain-containing protein n=1 Tax=Sedimenticola sp. TaxID=1940285 RepID=UPI003D0CBFEC